MGPEGGWQALHCLALESLLTSLHPHSQDLVFLFLTQPEIREIWMAREMQSYVRDRL